MSAPTLSVVIPVRDDAEALRGCLALLAAQSTAPLEVVVVDNASTDDSAALARAAGARVVSEPRPGIAAAAATGYDHARGDVIVRCDADTRPPPDWLHRIGEAFRRDPDLEALTGPGRFYDLPPVLGGVATAAYLLGTFGAVGAASANVPLWGSNMALRRGTWERVRDRVHREDPRVHDDLDLSFALGPTARVRFERRLRVGVEGRILHSPAAARQRWSWAWHTIGLHWRQESPGRRWVQRLDPDRRVERLHR